MHWSRGVDRHELDIDPLTAAYCRIAESGARAQDRTQLCVPDLRSKFDIDEPWPCCSNGEPRAAVIAGDKLASLQSGGNRRGGGHRVLFEGPRQDHCCVGGEIAVGRIAWRLARDPAEIEPGRE